MPLHRLRTLVRARRRSIDSSLSARGSSLGVVHCLLGRAVRPLVVAVSPLLEVRCQLSVVDSLRIPVDGRRISVVRAHIPVVSPRIPVIRSHLPAVRPRIPVIRSYIPVVHSHIPVVSPRIVVASSRISISGHLLPRGSARLEVESRLDDVHRDRISVSSSTLGVGCPALATSGKELDTLRLRLELDRRPLSPFGLVDPSNGISLEPPHSYECLDGHYNRPN